MSIVIGCDSFLSLRNVRNGEIGRRLAGERVIVLVDPSQYQGSVEACPAGVELDLLLQFDPNVDPDLCALANRAYYTRKSYYDPITFLAKLRASSYKNNPRPGPRRMASLAKAHYTVASHWVAGRRGLAEQQRQDFVRALRRHPVVEQYKVLLNRWDATVVVGLSPEGPREMALLEAANELDLPTAVMIRSRDNLAAKIQYLPYADFYLVWSKVIRDYFIRLYPEIPCERVIVTGSPQFDHHLDAAYRLDREAFFERVGLNPNKALVVYTMLTPGLAPEEINIAQHLADAAHAGKFARGAQLLVRGHPRMFGSNHKLLHREYKEAKSYPRLTEYAYKSLKHESQVVKWIIDDEPMHLSTLAYQDVQVNVNGTMTIDSAVLDKPTVNVCYDVPSDVNAGYSTRRLYRRADSKWMRAYGASRLALSPEECIRLINEYLENPEKDVDGRRRAREGDCGLLDGRSGERIVAIILQLSNRNTSVISRLDESA